MSPSTAGVTSRLNYGRLQEAPALTHSQCGSGLGLRSTQAFGDLRLLPRRAALPLGLAVLRCIFCIHLADEGRENKGEFTGGSVGQAWKECTSLLLTFCRPELSHRLQLPAEEARNVVSRVPKRRGITPRQQLSSESLLTCTL